eukprot:maker-scaffold1517_size37798-snap-gene-0.9 protein:Tk07835 transcript:maker-scaffold1517_size37798-snap-gene-0.9-mRNA-1 annotation:"van-gogh"
MDTEHFIPKKGSPDSGVHGANSSNGSLAHGFVAPSMARKKKSERVAPTLNHAGLIREASMNELNQGRHDPNGMVQSDIGLTNMGYSQENSVLSSFHDTSRLNESRDPANVDSDELQEVIEVQILPQDENWGETATAVTNTSDLDYANGGDSMEAWKTSNSRHGNRCKRWFTLVVVSSISLVAFLSPIFMVALPSFGILGLREQQLYCGVECDGMLVSLAFKLFVLAAGCWAVFARESRATLPRIRIFRSLVCLLVVVILISFWLFYLHHVYIQKEVHYKGLVEFALNLLDALLFVHYLAVLLMEIRHREARYYIKVVRSPDGESKGFLVGQMSVQMAATWVLDKYYSQFPLYNPFLDRLLHGNNGTRNRKSVKVYDIDGTGPNVNDCNSTVVSVASKRGYHHDRLLEEYEHNRKVEKRRARLMGAAEEAFTHIRRTRSRQKGTVEKTPMEPYDAAQAIFPTLARPLQKYLRATRQQPRHSMESILKHLSTCLSYDLSPRAFLEKYLVATPVLQSDTVSSHATQHWSLVCEKSLYRELEPGVVFQLRQGEVSLMCQVQVLPHFQMSEEIIDPNSNRFVLKINSETSV